MLAWMGASPYFKVKKWKPEPSQRASSRATQVELQPLVAGESRGCGAAGGSAPLGAGGGGPLVPTPDWPASFGSPVGIWPMSWSGG